MMLSRRTTRAGPFRQACLGPCEAFGERRIARYCPHFRKLLKHLPDFGDLRPKLRIEAVVELVQLSFDAAPDNHFVLRIRSRAGVVLVRDIEMTDHQFGMLIIELDGLNRRLNQIQMNVVQGFPVMLQLIQIAMLGAILWRLYH
jgi:hypothetical protein